MRLPFLAGALAALLALPSAAGNGDGKELLIPDLVPVAEVMEDYYLSYENGRTLLRFSSGIANIGDGPLEVNGERKKGRMLAYQRFYKGSRKPRRGPRVPFGEFEYHDVHRHWHLLEVAQYQLLDSQGQIVAQGEKISFCLMDTRAVEPPVVGAPPVPRYYGCETRAGARKLLAGISRGWMDIYDRHLYGQWVDVTGLPPGEYVLQTVVNPSGVLREKSMENNVAFIPVTLP